VIPSFLDFVVVDDASMNDETKEAIALSGSACSGHS
jgi:hypothetical protein